MWQCPINCKKYKSSLSRLEVSNTEQNKLKQEKDLLLIYRNCLDSLCKLSSEGFQILAVEKKESFYFAVALEPVCPRTWNEDRTIYLYQLPFRSKEYWMCRMWFNFRPNCGAHIIDWHSREENCGYGSILMKNFIAYLRSSGCRSISGAIRSADFDHEAKLRHFYEKFGFEITDYSNRRVLYLALYDKKVQALKKDGYLVCCRSPEHCILESEARLAADTQTQTVKETENTP